MCETWCKSLSLGCSLASWSQSPYCCSSAVPSSHGSWPQNDCTLKGRATNTSDVYMLIRDRDALYPSSLNHTDASISALCFPVQTLHSSQNRNKMNNSALLKYVLFPKRNEEMWKLTVYLLYVPRAPPWFSLNLLWDTNLIESDKIKLRNFCQPH